MSALTFAQGLTILQAAIADSSNTTFATQCLNAAQRDVARAHRWPELMVRAFFNTSAAYSTGTVAVSAGGTTWTLTGGTFPTDAATGLYRIALSATSPWYTITTRTDGTHVVTAAYQDDAETASGFLMYKSQYSLASDVDRVEEIWVHTGGDAVPLCNATTDQEVTQFLHYPDGPGVPTHFYNMERDASGYRQILLGPSTPDDVYRVEYVYRKQLTDGTLGLDDSRWPVVLSRAKALAYEPEFYERSLREQKRYEELLAAEWGHERESESIGGRVGQTRVTAPNYRGYDYLIGLGTVPEPTT